MPSSIAATFRFCLMLAIAGQVVAAQWQEFDVEDGLPQNSAVALAVDRFGLLWVGTEDGLARFDGSRFVAFEGAVDRGWIPGNYIVALAADDDYVWIAAESGGLARFDLQNEHFEILSVRNPDSGQSLNAWALTVDGDVLWVGTRDSGLYALDRVHPERVRDHWHNDASSESGRRLPLRSIRDIAVDSARQGYWAAGIGGLAFIDWDSGAVHADALVSIDRKRVDADVASVYSAADGTVWLGLRGHGVMRRRPGESGFTAVATGTGTTDPLLVNRLTATPSGLLAAATDRGLYLYQTVCDCFQPVQSTTPQRHMLGSALMLSALGDGDVIWAGSWNRGLFRFDPQAADFDLLTPSDLGGRDAPMSPRSLFVDRSNRLWIGSFGAGARYAEIAPTPMAQWQWRNWTDQTDSRDRQIWAYAESATGDLFIGSDAGVTRWRADGREQTHFDLDPEKNDELRSLLATSDGRIWASTVGAVYRIDPDTLASTRFAHKEGLIDARAYALAEWPRGQLVIGTWSGLHTMALDGDRIRPLPLKLDGKDYDAHLVWDLHPDRDGALWIGTSAGLLHLATPEQPALRRYAEPDGLPNAVVYAIEAHADELWLSTNRGIARFDKRARRAVAFTVQDGLQGNEFGVGMAAQDRDGRLYFAGLGGVSAFDPAHVQVQSRMPRTMLGRFYLRERAVAVGERVNGSVVLDRSLLATERIHLSHRDSDLGFAFSALAAEPSDRLRFQYRLDGKDAQWIEAGERRYVGYTNLAPGDYAFHVRASDRFGSMGPERRIDIDIAPPLWSTWPFRIVALIAIVALLLALLRWRFATLNHSRALLAAEVARQTERIREQNEQLETANHALFDRSIRDPLTGAFNRRHFSELAEHAYLGCRARAQPFALLLLDLDHFKQINDRHGHAAGDAVLCAVVQAIRPSLGHSEALARWGGEEFVVMLPDHDRSSAVARAAQLRACLLELRVTSGESTLRVTASIGVACASATYTPSLETLIADADAALYRAKAGGRDRVESNDIPAP